MLDTRKDQYLARKVLQYNAEIEKQDMARHGSAALDAPATA